MKELSNLELVSEAKQTKTKNKPGRKTKPKSDTELDTESEILERIIDAENEIEIIHTANTKNKPGRKAITKQKPQDTEPEAEPEQRIYFIKGPVYLDFET